MGGPIDGWTTEQSDALWFLIEDPGDYRFNGPDFADGQPALAFTGPHYADAGTDDQQAIGTVLTYPGMRIIIHGPDEVDEVLPA